MTPPSNKAASSSAEPRIVSLDSFKKTLDGTKRSYRYILDLLPDLEDAIPHTPGNGIDNGYVLSHLSMRSGIAIDRNCLRETLTKNYGRRLQRIKGYPLLNLTNEFLKAYEHERRNWKPFFTAKRLGDRLIAEKNTEGLYFQILCSGYSCLIEELSFESSPLNYAVRFGSSCLSFANLLRKVSNENSDVFYKIFLELYETFEFKFASCPIKLAIPLTASCVEASAPIPDGEDDGDVRFYDVFQEMANNLDGKLTISSASKADLIELQSLYDSIIDELRRRNKPSKVRAFLDKRSQINFYLHLPR